MFRDINRIRPSAVRFLEHGYYTDAIPGTKEYFDFWDEERNRC